MVISIRQEKHLECIVMGVTKKQLVSEFNLFFFPAMILSLILAPFYIEFVL